MRPATATATALTLVLLLGACGSESTPSPASTPESSASADTSSPEAALRTFLVALEAGSCADVQQVVVTPSTVDCEVVDTLDGSFADEGIDLADVTLSAGDVTGDSAVVTIDWGTDQDDETWDVQRVDGQWRVVYDSEA